MFKKRMKGWLKHWDFILIDIITMQFSFVLSYWLRFGFGNPWAVPLNRRLSLLFVLCQLLTTVFTDNYKNILHRGLFREVVSLIKYAVVTVVIMIVYLYIGHEAGATSRFLVFVTAGIFVLLSFDLRVFHKIRLVKRLKLSDKGKRSMILVTTSRMLQEALINLTSEDVITEQFIKGIVLLDQQGPDKIELADVPILRYSNNVIDRIRRSWVDEVMIVMDLDTSIPQELIDAIQDMGITLHYNIPMLNSDAWDRPVIGKVGRYRVITNSVHIVEGWKLAVKRLVDILGGLVGCLITGILYLFIAPAIKRKSPGPAFFSQERIGKNGKIVRMYKLRSMYLDAEARRAELMSQNKIESGLIFKIDDDPRIIGSEKKDKNGKPKGIGNFIRNTSLDEFPQFYNVLKGDMSLVGTRPPTKDEWEKYNPHHRIRMSVKPGITGIWQVSGRSEITDFEEIVRMDKEYVNTWSLTEDLKILLKTIVVVLSRRGAE